MDRFRGDTIAGAEQAQDRLRRLLTPDRLLGQPVQSHAAVPDVAVDAGAGPRDASSPPGDPWSPATVDEEWRGSRRTRWGAPSRAAAAAVVLAVVVALVVVLRAVTADADVHPVAPRAAAPDRASERSTAPAGSGAAAPSVGASLPWGKEAVPTAAGPAGPPATVLVHVVGRVRRPGVTRLPSGARVADAVAAAGGTTAKADVAAINLARPVVDGEQVVVPARGEAAPPAGAAVPGGTATAAGSASGSLPGSLVDLNTATEAQLDTLPGVGPVLAGRILQWRQEHGRFARVDDLGDVSGIGDTTLERLRPLVRV